MIQSSKLAVELWLNEAEDNAAGQVYTDKKVGRWLDLDTQQRELLAGRSDAFQKLSILKKQNRAKPVHKDGDKLRVAMLQHVMKSTDYKNLQSAFLKQVEEINQRVCPAN